MKDDIILKLFANKSGTGFCSARLRSSNFMTDEVKKYIYERTNFAPDESSIMLRLRLIQQNLYEIPKCYCGKPVSFTRLNFTNTCGYSCASKITARNSRDKRENTNLRKYGAKNPFGSESVKDKARKTNLKKYGVENYSTLKKKEISQDKLISHFYDGKTYKEIGDIHDMSSMTVRKNLIESGIDVSVSRKRYTSQEETKVCNFLHTLGVEYIKNYRKLGKEVDIFIPQHNLAIEINGIWYHSNNFKKPMDHINKTKMCQNSGIRLLQFWDLEVNDKTDIVFSMINNALGNSKRIGARQCIVKSVSKKEEKEFFSQNHIQGPANSKICLGLYFDNELISAMSFIGARYGKYDYELLRYCNKIGYSAVGGATKLFKNFLKSIDNNSTIVSYANLRFATGNLYKKMGFDYSGQSKPNYFYFQRSNVLQSRLKFQKHKLKNILSVYDANLSEKGNMKTNGWHWIYDCGNTIWVYK